MAISYANEPHESCQLYNHNIDSAHQSRLKLIETSQLATISVTTIGAMSITCVTINENGRCIAHAYTSPTSTLMVDNLYIMYMNLSSQHP